MKLKRWLILVLSIVMLSCSALFLVACGDDHEHTISGAVTKKATYDTTGEITYTCSECGETKTETIAALGASLDGFVSSVTELPEDQGYNVTFDASIVLGDSSYEYYDGENHHEVPAKNKVSIKGELFVKVTETDVNAMFGLLGEMVYYNTTNEYLSNIEVRAAIKEGMIYGYRKNTETYPTLSPELQEINNEVDEESDAIAIVDLLPEGELENVVATVGAYASLIEGILADPAIAPIISKIQGLEQYIVEGLYGVVNTFSKTEYKEGQIITSFSLDKVKTFNALLYTKKVEELAQMAVGANPIDKISTFIDQAFALTFGDVLDAVNTNGITNDQLADAIVAVMAKVDPENEMTKQDILSMMNDPEFKAQKISEFIVLMSGVLEQEGYETTTPAEFLAGVKATIIGTLTQYKDKTVYQIISELAEVEPVYIKSMVDTVIDLIESTIDVKLTTTSAGAFVSLGISINAPAETITAISGLFGADAQIPADALITASAEVKIGAQINSTNYDYTQLYLIQPSQPA